MELKENKTGEKAIYKTEFNARIDGNKFIAHFVAEHSSLTSHSKYYNHRIYLGDAVEIFISTGRPNYYYEIEVAPNGAIFLALIHNNGIEKFKGRKIKHNFIKAHTSINNDTYEAEIIIPLNKIHYTKEKGITFNAFRIETDGEKPEKHLFALSPTLCKTFHKKQSFIKFN